MTAPISTPRSSTSTCAAFGINRPSTTTRARTASPSTPSSRYEITVDDDYTVTMHLKRPFAEFLRMQNQSYGEPLMISPAAVKTNGNEGFAQHPIGTGRFKLVERK